jgi:hypothetical protein
VGVTGTATIRTIGFTFCGKWSGQDVGLAPDSYVEWLLRPNEAEPPIIVSDQPIRCRGAGDTIRTDRACQLEQPHDASRDRTGGPDDGSDDHPCPGICMFCVAGIDRVLRVEWNASSTDRGSDILSDGCYPWSRGLVRWRVA